MASDGKGRTTQADGEVPGQDAAPKRQKTRKIKPRDPFDEETACRRPFVDQPLDYSYRHAERYEVHAHLPGVARPKFALHGCEGSISARLALAIAVDKAAAESSFALDQERTLVRLSSEQRRSLSSCVRRLNHLAIEVQCAMLHMPLATERSRSDMGAAFVLWQRIAAPCYQRLRLPHGMRAGLGGTRLGDWHPSPEALGRLRREHGGAWGWDAAR